MTHLHKLRTASVLNWVSSNFVDGYRTPFKWPIGSLLCVAENPRFYGSKGMVQTENFEASKDKGQGISQISPATRRKAQEAFSEYLHSTRSLQFMDADYISKNSPHFLEMLLRKVDSEKDIGQSITRFLRYNPINEFEPFFEGMGLEPDEYGPLLPRGLMYLDDNDLLLENYHVLSDYGIARNKIGRIYTEAKEAFWYEKGVLASKIKAYERSGLSRPFMARMIVLDPHLFIGEVNVQFIELMEILRKGELEFSWIEKHFSEHSFCNWSQMILLLNLFKGAGYEEDQLARLIRLHPAILLECSGNRTLSLIAFLFKFGYTMEQICSVFLKFPEMKVEKFVLNLRQCFLFLNEIGMEAHEIGKIVRCHPLLLGSCVLKKANSLLNILNVGKKRLCKIISENPEEIKKWVVGSRVEPLPSSGEKLRSKELKTKFLLDLGIVENSSEMDDALKVFRGNGMELQERFDCIMKAGLDREVVSEMIRACPRILSQTKDVIEMKINLLVNDVGYPISSLVKFPPYLCFTMQRVTRRFSMYNWLKDQGKADRMLALSTLIASSDKAFIEKYVKRHPKGPKVWEDLKNKICDEQKLTVPACYLPARQRM